MEGRQK